MMTDRVTRLRQASLKAVPAISHERALLITRFYGEAREVSAPILRAKAFAHLLANQSICVMDGELIVGERGPAPKATSTCCELCCHSLEDLDTLDSREKTPYKVSPETRQVFEDRIIPFWQGRTMRERIFNEMSPAWLDCYEAGVFTEFMEQRAPGHTALDGKIYQKGMKDFMADIDRVMAGLDMARDPEAYDKRSQLKAMRVTAQALIDFSSRHADLLEDLAASEADAARKAELLEMARICRKVPAHKPDTFHEALQHYWFVHLGVIIELNPWDAFNPGRLDQHLYPFYQRELRAGAIDEEKARELLQCFWIKFNNHPATPKVGVTAAESGTYNDFATINLGGVRPDGSDGVNPLTYLLLGVIDKMRLLQPGSNIQLSAKNPQRFIKSATRVIAGGWGQPSVFNADSVCQELLRQGKSLKDAREGGTSGCVETGAFGKEAYILTGYFNLPKVLEITLNNGVDPVTGKRLGLKTGDLLKFESLDQLMEAFSRQVRHFIDIKMEGNHIIERLYARHMPVPFLSLVIDDCIEKGLDYNAGGARYNTSYIQGVGIGTLTDCFSALEHHVFSTDGGVSMYELMAALESNFEGGGPLRAKLLNQTPRYGNDDDRADGIMRRLFMIFYDAVNGRPNLRGGNYRINMLPTTCHVYFGSVMGASPDGRLAGLPVSEGISPVQGADRQGPTGVIKSASKMDHLLTGGTLLNQKFTPELIAGEEGIENLSHLVRTYFKLGGHHIQFNVVKKDTLLKAQASPDDYRDLIVRVAGYSDYFCDLPVELQNEIIARTEHQGF